MKGISSTSADFTGDFAGIKEVPVSLICRFIFILVTLWFCFSLRLIWKKETNKVSVTEVTEHKTSTHTEECTSLRPLIIIIIFLNEDKNNIIF